jgi:hypothetical protein
VLRALDQLPVNDEPPEIQAATVAISFLRWEKGGFLTEVFPMTRMTKFR